MSDVTERYMKAIHAMQTGVAAEMNIPSTAPATSPKHLRVGVNSALINDAAVARLLIAKGVFTEEEYLNAVADEAEREKAIYEERLSKAYGRPVTLG